MTNKKLIIRPGGMGDLICLTIAIEQMGKKFDDYEFIIEKRSELWAEYLGLTYYCYDRVNIWKVYLKNYQEVYNSEQHYGLAGLILALFYCRSKTHSFSTNRCQLFSRNSVPYDTFYVHEVRSFLNLLGGCQNLRLQKRKAIPHDYQVFYLSGTYSKARDIDSQLLSNFLDQHCDDKKLLYLISSPQEKAKLTQIADKLTLKWKYFEGDFRELVNFISMASRVFTIDGGSLHLCSYFGVPVSAIFTNTDWKKWHPLGAESVVYVNTDLQCAPCAIFGYTPDCPINYVCKKIENLKELKVEKIIGETDVS